MRIVADEIIADAERAFAAYGSVTLFDGRALSEADLVDADILLVRSVTRVDGDLLKDSPVRYVGTATAGIDHIAAGELDERGIAFFHAPGNNANAVAEFVTTAVVEFCRSKALKPNALSAGIIGYGEVGSRVAAKLGILGITALINDPPRQAGGEPGSYVSLEAALAADIVTLHTPLTASGRFPTRNLIADKELAALTRGGLLINCARGGVIDERALRTHLGGDHETTVVIDCWENEPRISAPLLTNAFCGSPHVAGHTIEARLRATAMLCSALDAALGLDNPWLGLQAATEPEPLYLDGPAGLDPIRSALVYCCPLPAIDSALRRALAPAGPGRAIGFDVLRRVFADRREFSHYKLRGLAHTSDAAAILTALGFYNEGG